MGAKDTQGIQNKADRRVSNYAILGLRYLQIVARRFVDDGCQHSAAVLAWMTLFAVVPMMTVTFSMFSLIPAFQGVGDQVQSLIFNVFISNAGNEVESYLGDFASQARKLSVVGVGILVATVYLMLHNIERVFNRIWATTEPRKGVAAFLLYWAVLSLGPLLLGSAILMNTYMLSIRLLTENIAQDGLNALFGYLPLVLTVMAFTLLYTVVPNCKVMLRNALTGGVVAALALESAKSGFGYFVSNSSYTSIYGAFAAVPIFLLWIYLCWMIILGGAEFVRVTENFGAEIRGRLPLHAATVLTLWLFWKAYKSGLEVSENELRQQGIASDNWRVVRSVLLTAKMISVTETGHYVLQRSLDDLSLWDLLCLFPQPLFLLDRRLLDRNSPNSTAAKWWNDYGDILEKYMTTNERLLSISLGDLFEQQVEDESTQETKESNVAKFN